MSDGCYVVTLMDGTVLETDQPDEAALHAWMRARGYDRPQTTKTVKFWYPKSDGRLARQQMLTRGLESAPGPPTIVRLESTNHCNAHCTFCPRDEMTRAKGIMAFPLAQRIIDQCAVARVPHVQLHNFGEALMDKMVADKVAYAKAVGIPKVSLISNGSLLRHTVSAALIEAQLDDIQISIDAASKESFEAVRVGLKYDGVVKNIETLLRLRTERGVTHPKLVLSFVYRENPEEVEQFSAQWRDRPGVTVWLTRLHNWAGTLGPARAAAGYPCSRLWQTLTVLWDGRVSLCCVDSDGHVILGDMGYQTLTDVWNGSLYREARRAHLLRTGPSLCLTCDLPLMDAPWVRVDRRPERLVEAVAQ